MTRKEYETKYGSPPPIPPKATTTQPASSSGGIGGTIGGLARGVGQSAVEGLQNIGKGAIKVATFGKVDTDKLGFAQDSLVAKTTPEKIGKFVGNVAQFAVPGMGIAKATKGASLVTKIAAEGLAAGGTAAIQEGGFDKNTRDAAILGALFPAAGKITSATKVKIGNKASSRIINSLIKPLKKDMAYGKNPGRAVAQEGIIASSLDELETKIGEKLTARLGELESILAKSKTSFDLSKVFAPLDEAMDSAVKQNNPTLLTRLQKSKQALTQNLTRQVDEETGEEIIRSAGEKKLAGLTAKEATQLKRDIGELTSFTGNPTDDKLVNSSLKRVYGNVKGEIDKKVPSVRGINERVADLISAKTATKYRSEIAERQNLISFSPKIVGGMGLATALFTSNPAPAIIGLGIAGLEKALTTPKAKTEMAQWLVKSTPNEKSVLFKSAPWAKGVIQRALLGGEDTP